LIALAHLCDLLCRMRGMGYGYYERHKVDLVGDPAWAILLKEHHDLAKMDLALFSFELDEAVDEVSRLVSSIFGGAVARNESVAVLFRCNGDPNTRQS
jgi:hypothetical protein